MDLKAVMTHFWNERARDNPFHFIASDVVSYEQPDIPAFFASGEEQVRRFLMEANYIVRGDETMLEIGCGIGRMTRAFASLFSTVYGIDISPEMIAQGQYYLADYPNVHLSVASGTDLHQFGDASIDFCFSYLVFQHIPDPGITVGYIHEIGRVLKLGGIAYFQLATNAPSPLSRLRTHIRLRTRLRTYLRRTSCEAKTDSPAWRGSELHVTRLQNAIKAAGLALDRLSGLGTHYTWVLCHR